MSAREFAEWRIVERQEPFGFPIQLHQCTMLAAILATLHNANRAKGEAAVSPSKFLPFALPRREEPSLEQQLGWARMFEARAKRGERSQPPSAPWLHS